MINQKSREKTGTKAEWPQGNLNYLNPKGCAFNNLSFEGVKSTDT